MTIARRLILDRLKTKLESISVANGYSTDVERVHRYVRTWSETANEMRCALCVVPGKETYSYQASQIIRVVFEIDVVGYVNAPSEQLRAQALSDLIDDIIAAIYTNQTWHDASGNDPQAVMTRVLESQTDEADENGIETVRVTLNVTYDRTLGLSS